MRLREKIFWLATAVAMIIGAVELIPGHGAVREVLRFFDEHNGSFTAVFTVVLAISTIGLWAATYRLWIAGERQFELASSVAQRQAAETKKSIEIAERAAGAAEKTLIETQRPWIELLKIVPGNLEFDSTGARITFIFDLLNAGSVPAINVRIGAFIHLLGEGQFDVVERQKQFCAEVEQWKGEAGPAVFGNRNISLSQSLPIPQVDIDAFSIPEPGTARRFILPILIGCIDYTLSVDGSHRQTWFAIQISAAENGEKYLIYPEHGNIAAERLHLDRWIGGGFYAR